MKNFKLFDAVSTVAKLMLNKLNASISWASPSPIYWELNSRVKLGHRKTTAGF